MVGKRSYTMEEILFVLDRRKDDISFQDIYDEHRVRFPNRPHKDSPAGIQYVWEKYKKDPSYVLDLSTPFRQPFVAISVLTKYKVYPDEFLAG